MMVSQKGWDAISCTLYRKCAIKKGRFLYTFKDTEKTAAEESSFLTRTKQNGNFNDDEYRKRKELFGMIVFESDHDLAPKTTYRCYNDRWLLELIFRR